MRLRMVVVPALLAAVTSVAPPVAAAPPTGGGPGCGGYWIGNASCMFVPVAALPIAFGGFAVGDDIAHITVSVHLGTPNGPLLGSCTATGSPVAACQGQVAASVPGFPHWCVVSGIREGAYGCVQDP